MTTGFLERGDELTFFSRQERQLTLQKTPTGRLPVIICNQVDDDKSYKDVHMSLAPDQIDQLKAWLASKESELTLIDFDCTLSLLRRGNGLEVKCKDPQAWSKKPAGIELEMTLDSEQVEKLTQWLAQPYE